LVLSSSLAAACSSNASGPQPIATISVSENAVAQSAEDNGASKGQAKPTFIEFYAEW
jgi:hypothetical protein